MSPTSVGDSGDSPHGIADLWVGDGNDNARHAVHAWIGDENGNPQPVDVPTVFSATDNSFCDQSGQFDSPEWAQSVNWHNLHFGNVAHVELWVDENDGNGFSEYDTYAVGPSGQTQGEDVEPVLTGAGEFDLRVRYQYDDGSHSEFSNTEHLSISNPCF